MLDDATVQDLQRHWDEGWNAGDLATIMAPFAADVVFSSPFVPRLTGDPAKTTINGYDGGRPRLHLPPSRRDGQARGGLHERQRGGPGDRVALPLLARLGMTMA